MNGNSYKPFYDKSAKRISREEWSMFFDNRKYAQIGHYEDDRIRISTVWLGLNHNYFGGAPLIFETMTFVKDRSDISDQFDQLQWRWRTEDEAKEGHETLVKCYHEGIDPEGPMQAVREKYD